MILILSLLLHLLNSTPISPSNLVIALNCGSKEQTIQSEQGPFKYHPDAKYVTGESIESDYHNDQKASSAQIKYTYDKDLYLYQRHSYNSMTYTLPLRKGKHTLILKFSQMYFERKGQRVFDIFVGSKIIKKNLDVIAESGSKYCAHEQYFEIDLRPDGLYYNGEEINDGLEGNRLKLTFKKGKADNPIIQAIIVYNKPIQNSPKKEFLNLKKNWNKQKEILKAKRQQMADRTRLEGQRKKEKVVIRNDQLFIEEDQTIASGVNGPKYGFLRSFLMGPIGILFWSVLLSFGSYSLYRKILKIQKACS